MVGRLLYSRREQHHRAGKINYRFDDSNYGTEAGVASTNGFQSLGLMSNSKTPSVANARLFKTQNTLAIGITNFTDGIFGQQITVLVNDNNTTFHFTGTNLKGNAAADFKASVGDYLTCTYDGTNWYCHVEDVTLSPDTTPQ
jgi:hypothetical protein